MCFQTLSSFDIWGNMSKLLHVLNMLINIHDFYNLYYFVLFSFSPLYWNFILAWWEIMLLKYTVYSIKTLWYKSCKKVLIHTFLHRHKMLHYRTGPRGILRNKWNNHFNAIPVGIDHSGPQRPWPPHPPHRAAVRGFSYLCPAHALCPHCFSPHSHSLQETQA